MKQFKVRLDINAEKLKAYYRRPKINLKAQTVCGFSLSIPLSNFQKFFTHEGLIGQFIITADHHGKVLDVSRA